MRIVSLAPSATAIVCALGARRQLVGVTRWCKDVAKVSHLPLLGDCWNCDAERVARLKPDLVLGSVPYRAEVVQSLLERNIRFVAKSPRTLEDIYTDIRLVGGLLGKLAKADDVVRKMKTRLEGFSRPLRKHRRRPRVYCETWPRPTITSPEWVAQLVQMAGGRPVPTRKSNRVIASREMLEADPDIIVLAWAAAGLRVFPRSLERRPGWRKLRAVRDKQVFVVRDELLNTPAPILTRGLQCLAGILAGDIRRLERAGAVRRLYR